MSLKYLLFWHTFWLLRLLSSCDDFNLILWNTFLLSTFLLFIYQIEFLLVKEEMQYIQNILEGQAGVIFFLPYRTFALYFNQGSTCLSFLKQETLASWLSLAVMCISRFCHILPRIDSQIFCLLICSPFLCYQFHLSIHNLFLLKRTQFPSLPLCCWMQVESE